jgi:hypothetical protein
MLDVGILKGNQKNILLPGDRGHNVFKETSNAF